MPLGQYQLGRLAPDHKTIADFQTLSRSSTPTTSDVIARE
jgi:hypothetical protein